MHPSLLRLVRLAACAAIVVAAVGCGPAVLSEPLNAPVRSMTPRDPSEVALLTQKPDQRFVEVSALRVWDGDFDFSSGTLFDKLRAFGGRLGCDAVVVVGRSDSKALFDPKRTQEGYLATCIQYLSEPLVPPAMSASATGTVRVVRGPRVIEVDGQYVRLADERVTVACGRHKVRTSGIPRYVEVPCGRTVTLD